MQGFEETYNIKIVSPTPPRKVAVQIHSDSLHRVKDGLSELEDTARATYPRFHPGMDLGVKLKKIK